MIVKVILVGSSTFGLRTPEGEDIAHKIGKHFSNSSEIITKNALELHSLSTEDLNKFFLPKLLFYKLALLSSSLNLQEDFILLYVYNIKTIFYTRSELINFLMSLGF